MTRAKTLTRGVRAAERLAVVGIAVTIAVTLIVVILVVIVFVISGLLGVKMATEFSVSEPTCDTTPRGEVLVAVELSPLEPGRVGYATISEVVVRGGRLAGVASMPAGVVPAELTGDEMVALYEDLDDLDHEVDGLGDEPRVVVLRVRQDGDEVVEVERLTVWFAYGEPAAQQDVPIGIRWDGSCLGDTIGYTWTSGNGAGMHETPGIPGVSAVAPTGVDPVTFRFSVGRSTN